MRPAAGLRLEQLAKEDIRCVVPSLAHRRAHVNESPRISGHDLNVAGDDHPHIRIQDGFCASG